jgi:FkbM family methyltransferase
MRGETSTHCSVPRAEVPATLLARTLNTIGRALRSSLLPKSFSYKVWHSATRVNSGETFFYKTALFKKPLMYGGVCGASDDALFLDLEENERDVIPVLSALLKGAAAPNVLDVGANNGAFMVLVKAINPGAEVHCFEPFPMLANFLSDLVKRNSFEGVFVNNLLVGETDDVRKLYFTRGSTVTASVVEDFQASFNSHIEAEQQSLDSYVAKSTLNEISLIKIDVEGGELEVIEGAVETLKAFRPNLLLELLYTQNPEHAARQNKTILLLTKLGYRFHQIREQGRLVEQNDVKPDPNYCFLNYLVTSTEVSGLKLRHE